MEDCPRAHFVVSDDRELLAVCPHLLSTGITGLLDLSNCIRYFIYHTTPPFSKN